MQVPPKRNIKRLITIILTALIAAPLLTGSVNADTDPTIMERICPVDPYPEIEIVGTGSDSILEVPDHISWDDVEHPDNPDPHGLPLDATTYGQYGTSGLQWHAVQTHCLDGVTGIIPRSLGNTLWEWTKNIGHTSIVVYSYALSDGVTSTIGHFFANIITSMRDTVFYPYLPAVIFLGAIWMAWQGLMRQRATLTLEGAAWMVACIAISLWVMAAPLSIINLANTFVGAASAAVNSSVSWAMQEGGGAATSGRGCPPHIHTDSESLDEDDFPIAHKAEWESYNNYFVRLNSDVLYRGLLCEPWMNGQFGDTLTGEIAGIDTGALVFQSQAVSRIEIEEWQEGARDNPDYWDEVIVPRKQELYDEAKEDVESTYPDVYPIFSGEYPTERGNIAFMALLANILMVCVVIILSVALLIAKIAFLIALVLFPIVALIGVHPGWGRRVFIRWFEITIGILLKQVFFTFIMALYVGVASMVLWVGDLTGGLVTMFCFLGAMLVYRRHIGNFYTQQLDGKINAGRVMDGASRARDEMKSAGWALPPVAYMRMQKWGWRNKHKVAGAALGAAAASSAAAGRTPIDPHAPKPRGVHGRASRALDRVTGERTEDPGRGANSWARRHMDEHATPRPSSSGGDSADAPPLPRESTKPEPSRAKGMLGRRDRERGASAPDLDVASRPPTAPAPAPVRDGTGGRAAPRPSTTPRTPEDAPDRVWSSRSVWRRPPSLDVVDVRPPRRRALRWSLRPFGDGKKGGDS